MENTTEMSSDKLDSQTVSLSSIFQEGLDLYNNLGKIDEPTNSPVVQLNVSRSIKIFEDATRLVSIAGIFSSNENVEEIATENLRYLLLPALLGSLCLKLTSRSRQEVTEVSEIYYKDFLTRCGEYGLCEYKNDKQESLESSSEKTPMEQMQHSIHNRANKIQRFKEQKELKTKLESLKQSLENEHVDEDIKRNYFLTMIKLFINEAVDELSSIESEKQILEYMANLPKEDKPKPKRPMAPLKPLIITKDSVQKAVFGAGYPSLPVMTVEEFYEKRVRDGIFPDASKTQASGSLQDTAASSQERSNEDEDIAKENKMENDDPEYLESMRHQDEFKDEHRRGYGNRANRS